MSRPGEADQVADLFLSVRTAAARAGTIPAMVGPVEEVRRFVASLYVAHIVRVATAPDGDLHAVMVTTPGWLDHLYVRPDLAGHGLGSRLVEVAKRHCKGSLDLWTFQGNLGARRFYERRGFTAIEFTDGAANMEQAPDVRYRWTAQPGEGPPPSR